MAKMNWDKTRRQDLARAQQEPHRNVKAQGAKPDQYGYIQMTNRFDGHCGSCGRPVQQRAKIWWHPTWKIVACSIRCRLVEQPETYASARRQKMAQSKVMKRQGGDNT